MTYLEKVWDLVKKKEYDEAWRESQSSLQKIIRQFQYKGWSKGVYEQKVRIMGEDWAKEDFLEDMKMEVGSILYAMATICYKEGKFASAYDFIKASELLDWSSSGVSPLLKATKKKLSSDKTKNTRANKIASRWQKLFFSI